MMMTIVMRAESPLVAKRQQASFGSRVRAAECAQGARPPQKGLRQAVSAADRLNPPRATPSLAVICLPYLCCYF
jgi:hypothetical protein